LDSFSDVIRMWCERAVRIDAQRRERDYMSFPISASMKSTQVQQQCLAVETVWQNNRQWSPHHLL
jgi:hypothetical protein